jgi:hypothetical protein
MTAGISGFGFQLFNRLRGKNRHLGSFVEKVAGRRDYTWLRADG